MLICLISCICFAAAGQKITAMVNMYSGRAAPQWEMTASEVSELKARIERLPQAQRPSEIPSYRYVVVQNPGRDPALPYYRVYLFDKMVITDDGKANKYLLDNEGVMDYMKDLGNRHDPNYQPPKYETLPANTPYIAVIPSSFEETIQQGATLRKTFTIFSEGNAPLQGSIEVPDFVRLDKKEFRLQAIEGVEDFVFSVDTTNPGVKDGVIVIRSNDPSNQELSIPVSLKVVEKPRTIEEKQQGSTNYLIYIILIVLLGAIAFILFTKKKK